MAAFPPLIGTKPTRLILGSMPSQRSLADSQYYAHPQNCFWWILARLIGFKDDISYKEKCQQLMFADYALWDVLHDCQRQGSLDSNIKRESEQANNFDGFLKEQPSITLIAFNGAAAKQIFMRHCVTVFNTKDYLEWVQLPSSSPAHASLNRQQKLSIWRDKLSTV